MVMINSSMIFMFISIMIGILLMEKSFMKLLIMVEFGYFILILNLVALTIESSKIETPLMIIFICILGAIFNLLMLILWSREKSFSKIMNMNI